MQISKIFLLFSLVLFLASCNSDPSVPVNKSGMSATVPAAKNNYVKPTPVDHSILAPIIAHWEVQTALKVKDQEMRESLDGAWFNLNLDQTFTFGQFESQTNEGTYNYDDATNIIEFFFSQANKNIPTQYKILGIGTYDGGTLIWSGNTPKNPRGMSLKMTKKIN